MYCVHVYLQEIWTQVLMIAQQVLLTSEPFSQFFFHQIADNCQKASHKITGQ